MVHRNDRPGEPDEPDHEEPGMEFDGDAAPQEPGLLDDEPYRDFEYPGPSADDIARSESGDDDSRFNTHWLKSAGAVLLVFAALGLLISLVGPLAFSRGGGSQESVFRSARVQQVVDGNTIVVSIDGRSETVRYIGISVGVQGESLHRASRLANQSLVGGEIVILERDNEDRDTDGRLLRYVYVNNQMVNALLINSGLGRYLPDRSNSRYNSVLLSTEDAARNAQRGIWAASDLAEASPA